MQDAPDCEAKVWECTSSETRDRRRPVGFKPICRDISQTSDKNTFSTMWLLDTSTLELRDFVGAGIPEKYAILSHTWDIDEVTFRDMRKDREAVKRKAGYVKIKKCCEKAQRDGLQYVWIDTCCIDKRSSAELSEAINSMYRWYERSTVCYAYLADVPSEGSWSEKADYEALRKSRWFTRGWTLQELLAPRNILFLGVDWEVIGAKASDDRKYNETFLRKVAEITRIDERALRDSHYVQTAPAALKMSWAAQRETTREEDLAYALMGLFAVSMPILYGEGLGKAFRRLQLEIIQLTTDQSIFVWRSNCLESGLLADSPRAFEDSGLEFVWKNPTLQPYSMTNLGLQVKLPVKSTRDGEEIVLLRCWARKGKECERIGIFIRRVKRRELMFYESGIELYRRTRCETLEMTEELGLGSNRKELYFLQDEQADHISLIDGGQASLGRIRAPR